MAEDHPSFRTPRAADLPEEMRGAAAFVARRLATAGHRAWIVGGAVRDLCLGRPVKDVDLVSAATPDEVEALFDPVIAVGRAFGILRIPVRRRDAMPSDPDADRAPRIEVELATYRTETGYADSRRPDAVHYGTSAEEDALRRDFTCNALYLDPLDDTCLDPTGGLHDLAAGKLAAVGDAAKRFAEDGLRLLRMARFEAQLELEPAPGLHDAARASRDSLRGVSRERVLEELGRAMAHPAASRALAALEDAELLPTVLPRWWSLQSDPVAALAGRRRALDARPPGRGRLLGLGILLDAGPAADDEVLAGLPLPRGEERKLKQAWSTLRELPGLDGDPARRARALRGEEGALALALYEAWSASGQGDPEHAAELRDWLSSRTAEQLDPVPLLDGRELQELGVPRGPVLGATLSALVDAQLRGEVCDPDQARAWLAGR